MTYVVQFRKHILTVKAEEELTFKETSKRFCVSTRSLYRWNAQVEPCQKRNCSPRKIDDERLREDVKHYPDSYQKERAQRLGVSRSGICQALARLKITRKKNQLTSKGR